MATIIESETSDVIEFNDFVKFLDNNIEKLSNLSDFDELPINLQKLANNRTFLSKFIDEGINNLHDFQDNNSYAPQVFVLHKTKYYFIRVNFWPTSHGYSHPEDEVNHYFVYEKAHDHNFSFATVGYSGSGYNTKLYSYDYDSVKGVPGEKVEIVYHGSQTLTLGKVIIFETSKDIHIQYPPLEGSISINVIPYLPVENTQYLFDIENSCIESVEKQNNFKRNLSVLLRYFGDEESKLLYGEVFGCKI